MSDYLKNPACRFSFSLLLAALLLVGCSSGDVSDNNQENLLGGSTTESAGEGGDENQGESTSPLLPGDKPTFSEGTVLARLVQRPLPLGQQFVLQATLPIPENFFPRANNISPFTIKLAGKEYPAQTEIVSRYPDGDADVVELLALVPAVPANPHTGMVSYDVIYKEHEIKSPPQGLSAAEMLMQVKPLATPLKLLLEHPDPLRIRAYHHDGDIYEAKPLEGPYRVRRYGNAAVSITAHHALVNTTDAAKNSMGVMTTVTTFAGTDTARVDLHFHNGHTGLNGDGTPSTIHVNDKVYFKAITLVSLPGTKLFQMFPDPFFGRFEAGTAPNSYPGVVPGKVQHVIIDSLKSQDSRPFYEYNDLTKQNEVAFFYPATENMFHMMPEFAQLPRRTVLTSNSEEKAAIYLHYKNLAFAERGSANGTPLFSWWNPKTQRLYPGVPIPHLDVAGVPFIQARLKDDYESTRLLHKCGYQLGVMVNANTCAVEGVANYAMPVLPNPEPMLGPYYVRGSNYGGQTGSFDVKPWTAVQAAYAASSEGILALMAKMLQATHRQPQVLRNTDGSPADFPNHVALTGSQGERFYPWVLFNGLFVASKTDPFGYHLSTPPNVPKPGYESRLLEYAPQDYQHFLSYTLWLHPIARLINDPLTKDDMLMNLYIFLATTGRMEPVSPNHLDHLPGGSLIRLWQRIYNLPDILNPGSPALPLHADGTPDVSFQPGYGKMEGNGSFWGRGEAHTLDAAIFAYAVAPPHVRNAVFDKLKRVAIALGDANDVCNGMLLRKLIDKWLDGEHYTTQTSEESYSHRALRNMAETLFRGVDESALAVVEETLLRGVEALASPEAWDENPSELFGATWSYIALGPHIPTDPIEALKSYLFSTSHASNAAKAKCILPPPGGPEHDPPRNAHSTWISYAMGAQLAHDRGDTAQLLHFLQRAANALEVDGAYTLPLEMLAEQMLLKLERPEIIHSSPGKVLDPLSVRAPIWGFVQQLLAGEL